MASSAQTASRLLDDGLDWEVPFIYGTAWKKSRTEELVQMAVAKGFRKFDTAAQPKHYQEPLVGAALREAYKDGNLKREDIYVGILSSSTEFLLTTVAANEVYHTCWTGFEQHAL